MNQATIKKMNQINQNFYQEISTEFSATRQQAWPGWTQLLPIIEQKLTHSNITVLDVGCGNGRFGQFVHKNLPSRSFTYYGLDSNQPLLDIAQENLSKILPVKKLHLIQTDLTENLHSISISADLIVVFGVLHHIPSLVLRKKLLQQLALQLQPGGLLILTAWQFDQTPNIFNRRKKPTELGFVASDLEPNDYFLNWERGEEAVRYCHLITDSEMDDLVVATQLSKISSFAADGQNNQTNNYVVLQKQEK